MGEITAVKCTAFKHTQLLYRSLQWGFFLARIWPSLKSNDALLRIIFVCVCDSLKLCFFCELVYQSVAPY